MAALIVDMAFSVWPLSAAVRRVPPTPHLLAGALLPLATLGWLIPRGQVLKPAEADVKPAARWTAVILAVVLGAFTLRPGTVWVGNAWRRQEWLILLWGLCLFMSLLPLRAVALLRARMASYAALGIAACSATCALLISLGPWRGIADAASRPCIAIDSAVPTAVIGTLLWYSMGDLEPGAESERGSAVGG